MKSQISFAAAWCVLASAVASAVPVIDRIDFGVAEAERAHSVKAERSDVVATATLGLPARRLLPLEPASWQGGRMSFRIKVDPNAQNYFTARFSGDEVNDGRLYLHVDGKQIGWRHLGEVDPLDFGTWEPAYRGRFYYNTSPLPLSLTKGKTEIDCEIRSTGRLWGYGTNFEQYQKAMEQPSRGIYAVYTHVDGHFVPPADERQGEARRSVPAKKTPGAEVLDQIEARVNREVDARLNAKAPLTQMQMVLLAKAYDVRWTSAHQNSKAVEQIVATLDGLYAQFKKDPKLAREEKSTWNPDWFGLGPCGQVIALREKELAPRLDELVDADAGAKVTRRAAYAAMLLACRDWHRLNRRQYTNQTMLNDLNGIYLANRGIAVVAPAKALPEAEARRYLYESVGLEPWRDSDAGGKRWNVGPDYWQLTAKGLTKELGFVGTYGEVVDLVADIYNVTRPTPRDEGDPKIKAQFVKVALARAAMRHPSEDADGDRTMRLEQVVGWRDSKYPGEPTYGQRATRDASALQAAVATLDPTLIGIAQQQIADGQFFASEVHAMDDSAQPLRTTIGRLETPEQYEAIQKQPKSEGRLPMGWDRPDFVFTDEEDGVVAIKHGREILYASLYWRARFGINNLARVHYLTPEFDRIAVVAQETNFEPSGQTFAWPDWTNMAFGNGGVKYPIAPASAYTGQTQPIAKPPEGVTITPGKESPYAGRGDFYTMRYGPYLIGLNMSKGKTFDLPVSAGAKRLNDGNATRDGTIEVGPRTTAVFYIAE